MKPENVIPFEARAGEIPSIKLSPEQIEEIHTDEYSLMLFYATRIEPLSIEQIKRKFPEPEAKKAQSVLDRFVASGLIQRTSEGKYFSNYPVDAYLNYSDYRYDGTLETKKDQKVFEVMKEHASSKSYWRDRIYFSIDAFFSNEQSEELHRMFAEIRKKAKQFSAENRGKSVDKLRFRRLKFYDMFFMLTLSFFVCFGVSRNANAMTPPFLTMKTVVKCNQVSLGHAQVFLTGGNDPGMRARAESESDDDSNDCGFQNTDYKPTGGGHDPGTDPIQPSDDGKSQIEGGGHDPGGGGTHSLPGKPNQIRPEGGGHDPGGGGTTGVPGSGSEKIMNMVPQCDWSNYENLLSYPAEVVCSRLHDISIEPACAEELQASCSRLVK